MHLVQLQHVQPHKPVHVLDVVQQLQQHLVTVTQAHIKQVLMQHIVQESVQDVLPMVYLQQHIAGQQQHRQHVQLLEQQNVPIVAKPRHFQRWDMHLVQPQLVQLHKHVHVLDVVQQ